MTTAPAALAPGFFRYRAVASQTGSLRECPSSVRAARRPFQQAYPHHSGARRVVTQRRGDDRVPGNPRPRKTFVQDMQVIRLLPVLLP
jgi:hypothetical protein